MKSILCTLLGAMIVCAVLFLGNAMGQSLEAFRERIERVKEKYDFDNWGPETGKVISGVAISEKIFPPLSQMRKVWREDSYSVKNVQEVTYTEIRKWWRLENDQFEVTMVVGPTFEAAKEYLILGYAYTQREPPLIKPPGREFGLNVGNVCFVTVEEEGEAFSSIDFIRHNVLFMMKAEGAVQKDLRAMAETLDALLLKKKPVGKYEQLPDLPTIKTFSLEKAKINLGEEVLLSLEVNNPQQRELRYFWTMTGGGVEKDLLENFVYYGGDEGKQHITVTVVNDIGLHDSKSADIEVVKP